MCEIALNFYNSLRFYFALLVLSLLSLLFICIITFYFIHVFFYGGYLICFFIFSHFCAFVSSSISNYNINRDKALYLRGLYVCEVLSTPL